MLQFNCGRKSRWKPCNRVSSPCTVVTRVMILRRRNERAAVLWSGLSVVVFASWWLSRRRAIMKREHESQIDYHNRRRIQQALSSEEEEASLLAAQAAAQSPSSSSDTLTLPLKPHDTLFMRAVAFFRTLVFGLWLSNFVATEVSEIYLQGHTGTVNFHPSSFLPSCGSFRFFCVSSAELAPRAGSHCSHSV